MVPEAWPPGPSTRCTTSPPALGHRLDQVTREAAAEQGFEFDFERFALQLLRALVSPSTPAWPCRERSQGSPAPFLYGQLDFAFGVFEFTLLAQHIGLGLLGLGKLRIVRGEHLLQIRKLAVALAEIVRERKTRLFCLRFGDGGALGPQLGRDLFIDGFARLGEVVLRLPELGLTTAEIGFLGCKLRFEPPAGLGDQGRCKRFGQLDLGAAFRADDLRVVHGFGPVVIARDCIGISGADRAVPRCYPRQSRRSW
jgi:hypothetical protein